MLPWTIDDEYSIDTELLALVEVNEDMMTIMLYWAH